MKINEVATSHVAEELGSIPPLADLIVMAVVGQTTVAALKTAIPIAFKTGKGLLKLKRLADKAGVKLARHAMGEDIEQFDPENPMSSSVAIDGYGVLNLDTLMKNISRDLQQMANASDNPQKYRNLEYQLYNNGVFKAKLEAVIDALNELQKIKSRGGKRSVNIQREAFDKDAYAAKLAVQQQDKFFKAALAALDRLVKSDPRGQSVGGYAFDIARAFQGIDGKELARAYDANN